MPALPEIEDPTERKLRLRREQSAHAATLNNNASVIATSRTNQGIIHSNRKQELRNYHGAVVKGRHPRSFPKGSVVAPFVENAETRLHRVQAGQSAKDVINAAAAAARAELTKQAKARAKASPENIAALQQKLEEQRRRRSTSNAHGYERSGNDDAKTSDGGGGGTESAVVAKQRSTGVDPSRLAVARMQVRKYVNGLFKGVLASSYIHGMQLKHVSDVERERHRASLLSMKQFNRGHKRMRRLRSKIENLGTNSGNANVNKVSVNSKRPTTAKVRSKTTASTLLRKEAGEAAAKIRSNSRRPKTATTAEPEASEVS